MIIERIRLRNFLSHSDSDIYFDTGINMIIGQNGAGKSSIVDAIRFALFSDKRTRRTEDMIKKGERYMEVELYFRSEGHSYRIRRTIERRGKSISTDAEIERDGSIITRGASDVSNYVEKNVLNINKDVFLTSIFVRQGEMDALVSKDPAERKKILDEILNIDRLEAGYLLLKEVIDDLTANVSDYDYLKNELQSKINEIDNNNKQIEELESKLRLIEPEIKALEEEINIKENKKDHLNEELHRLNAQLETIKKYEMELAESQSRKASIEMEVVKLPSIEEELKRLENNAAVVKRNEIIEYINLKKDLGSLSEIIEGLKSDLSKYDEAHRKLEDLQSFRSEFLEKKKRKEDLDKLRSSLKEDEDNYQSAVRNIENIKKWIENEEKEIERMSAFISEILKIQEITPEIINSRRAEINSSLMQIEGKIASLNASIDAMRSHKMEVEENAAMLSGRGVCPVCGTHLGTEKSEDLVKHYGEEASRLEEDINKTENEIKKLDEERKHQKKLLDRINGKDVERLIASYNLLSSKRAELKKFMDDEARLKEAHLKAEAAISQYNSIDLGDLEAKNEEWLKANAVISSIDIENIRSRFEEKNKQLNDIIKRMNEIEVNIPDVESYNENSLKRIDEELNSLRNKKNELYAKKAAMDEIQKTIEHFKEEISKKKGIEDSQAEVNAQLLQINDDLKQLSSRLDKINVDQYEWKSLHKVLLQDNEKLNIAVADIRKRLEKKETIIKAIADLKRVREAFSKDGVPAIIRKSASEFITNQTRQYIQRFELDIDDVDVDQDFNITVFRGGIAEGIDSLSGGERMAVAFALRVAIAQFLNKDVSLLVMDEPTAFLDEDRRSDLANIIEYSLKDSSGIPQVIMISHHRELLSASDLALEVKKRNGSSIVDVIR
ncbi:purine NTPase [Thermoplasma volcanium GSS1]|uniref:DNA double-strand break repair Rad50 ATPase n=1 Tax=Thermoplasma volcanium (strain ATCC 51530 / DSM 4299 / JCM 9571 / NBRC 15438 / GSS1) TaxID=273116 RepID=RAD50_THEVO|nr:DNA double-strand break repair ATPase Rad50 [Thermoplasma volcanium]P58302.1 RecName: Full=DNA double-strand break repair Rad50 ATPase [Thermoplasma volcanium GSS1]BAB59370.1 purine NTPase [Thermoplasma volcanium GSS1]